LVSTEAVFPAIVLTASLPSEIEVSHATFLQKPVRMKALLEAVRARLGPARRGAE